MAVKISDRAVAIRDGIRKAWADIQGRNYTKEPLSLWMSRDSKNELLNSFSCWDFPPVFQEPKTFSDVLTFLGMIVHTTEKLADNRIIVCTGSQDADGIPSYKRAAVIDITPTTTYDINVQLENPW